MNVDIAHLESCKDFPCYQQCSSCGVISFANPLLEEEEEQAERYLCFHQQLHPWIECRKMMLLSWRPAVSLNSIL